jgi:hypothetical protein
MSSARAPPPAPPSSRLLQASPSTLRLGSTVWLARLILDTGADRTTITPRILRAAGLAPRRTTTILGVAGQADVDVYEIASLEVGGAKVGPLTVYGYDTAKLGSDGLLGRDFLDQFTVTIDNAVGLVTLSTK